PEQFDRAEADAASTMTGNAAGLVEHEEFTIFVDNRLLDPIHLASCRLPWILALGHPHRRNAHLVTGTQAHIRLGPAPIDAHLPRTQDPINQAAGNPLQSA